MKDKELLLLTGKYCAPCKEFKKKFYAAENEYPEIQFMEIDIEEQRDLVREYRVRTVPTLIYLHKRIKVGEKIHPYSKEDIQEIITEADY